ncbi:hypothetical protein BJ875DRAFT_481338 [Amylocarpus encephaloides]|uniref:NAD(P)-binding domain-containing protein n=1 Tax=Amylocarpus encephaloides TaxID=45428 RepID=A0A9P7YPM4_9HELO|nr:hypothetical protein BJ875DRAFT_481338 [Amylocarpus encephaloides]
MSFQTLPRTVAMFGSTGGTGIAALKHALANGSHVNALVRTPAKLSDLLAEYPNTLHLTQADMSSLPDIKRTLIDPLTKNAVPFIISSLGMNAVQSGIKLKFEGSHTLCYDGALAIVNALQELQNEGLVPFQPRIVLLSTTGISKMGRDVPVVMLPMYNWMLQIPHEDKEKMESLMIYGAGRDRRWVMIRPSFLVENPAKGLAAIRSSCEVPGLSKKEQEPVAMGYAISKEDVGQWIVERLVKEDGVKFDNKMVSLT